MRARVFRYPGIGALDYRMLLDDRSVRMARRDSQSVWTIVRRHALFAVSVLLIGAAYWADAATTCVSNSAQLALAVFAARNNGATDAGGGERRIGLHVDIGVHATNVLFRNGLDSQWAGVALVSTYSPRQGVAELQR